MNVDAVRTPLEQAPALALGNRRYRKQILKVGDLHYQGGTFPITPAYIRKVVDAFDGGAIKRVPFQLADASNNHTEDPLRRFGTVTSLHQTPDGLDAVIELNDDAARLVDDDPDFGVSVLIKHDRTTGEGQHYDAVLAHVLGTTDPVLTTLEPWREQLAASHDGGQVLDLLALTIPTATTGAPMADTAPLTPEDVAALRSLASIAPKLAALVQPKPDDEPTDEAAKTTDEPDSELTDADLAAMLAAIDEPADQPQPVAAAQAQSDEVLALSQQLAAAQQAQRDDALRLAQVEAKLAAKEYAAERDQLAREFGIHPRITDIVRPLLEGAGVGQIALANGAAKVDVAELVRKFARELARAPRLDLSQAVGTAVDVDADQAEATERDTFAADYAKSLLS